MDCSKCRKAYVSVNLDVDEEGVIRPRLIRWNNGLIFQIDQILYKMPCIIQKGGRWRHPLYSHDPGKGIIPFPRRRQVVC